MYEGKFIGKPEPFRDKVRTFCQNPSGFVSEEVYDEGISLVNGHSYKEKKSTNTNLAILVSHHFTYPFHKPIDYGRNVAKNVNELGNGNILVQRLGDILKGKRTWEIELKENSFEPTLKSAVAGDITFECEDNKVHIYVSSDSYMVDYLENDNHPSSYGKYIGTLKV